MRRAPANVMIAAMGQAATGRLTDDELAELRVRLSVLSAIDADLERLGDEMERARVTRAIVTNERRLFTRSIFKRLGLAEDASFTIDTQTGEVRPAEDQS